MKLFRDDDPYISKRKWKQIFLAMSIMVLVLYVVAMICSLCGSTYFILNYQNEQMDKIEAFLKNYKIYPLAMWLFNTFEFTIIISFVRGRLPKWYYVVTFYGIAMIVSATIPSTPTIFYQIYPFAFYLLIPLIEQLVVDKKFDFKKYLFKVLKLLIAVAITYVLQVMIYVIKDGDWSFENHVMNLSATFIYALEYDIALSVILFTILLYIDREKGDNIWATYQVHGGSSQVSKTQLPTSNTEKKPTKTQKNKIRLFYAKVYFIQLGTFLLVMVLPFLLGKVFEFLVMYLAFCVTRSILGFKYSLHYKKESLCATVGVVVFGILSLVVPFFYVVLIIAVSLGVGLAVLLHLSYKYKGFYLFTKRAKPDKFAEISVIFDDDLSRKHVMAISLHRGLTKDEAQLMADFAEGNKKSYLAKKYNYSEKTIERNINDCIDKLKSKE